MFPTLRLLCWLQKRTLLLCVEVSIVGTLVPCGWRGRVSGRWGNNYSISWLHLGEKGQFCVETKIFRCSSIKRQRRDPDFQHKLAVFVMVKPGRLRPPALSVHDVPGRAGGGGTSSTKPELLAPLVKTKLRLLFPSSDSLSLIYQAPHLAFQHTC